MSGDNRIPVSTGINELVGEGVEEALAFEAITKVFGSGSSAVDAVATIDLGINRGQFVAFVGPSGCGKTTLMNMVAGLIRPTSGTIRLHGHEIRGPTPGVGYVTQRDNLLPWRTIQRNVELGLEIDGVERRKRRERAYEALSRVGLEGFESKHPHQLSGGMRQRVNIARTMARDPDLVLMDEPFGSLDAITRGTLQNHLMSLWTNNQTIMFVTHDLLEAIALSDRVIIMSARPGRIVADIPVRLPRPRDAFKVVGSAGFTELHDQIWSHLAEELGPGVPRKDQHVS